MRREQNGAEFGRNKALSGGLSFYCLVCSRAKSNARYRVRRQALGKPVRDHSWIPAGFRWCPSCERAVPHADYVRNEHTSSGFGSRCRPCDRSANSAGYFYRKYKLTPRELLKVREAQNDRCAICAAPGPGDLDHDHVTGRIRRLLCQRCNHGLGLFRDDPFLLRMAAHYLDSHREDDHEVLARHAVADEPEGADRSGEPPVGSDRRPGGRGTSRRNTGRTSGSRRRTTAGEADG